MPTYVAFLRGINSGRNPTTKMEVLKRAFENLGFQNVKTVIASGNVIFDSSSSSKQTLERTIEQGLPDIIGFRSATIVLRMDEAESLLKKDPFRKVRKTAQMRAYLTFVRGEPSAALKFPVKGKGFTILGIVNGVVTSVIDHAQTGSPDLMKVLDKLWNENTTRGWPTIERIVKEGRKAQVGR